MKMSKPVCLVTAPVGTRSGYGAHSRDIVHSLIDLDLYDVKIMPVRWGSTPQNALDENNPEDKKLLDRFLPEPNLEKQPELHIHIVVPNEFQTWGKYNIGITAGAEFTAVRPEWLEGLNRMDLNIVPSEFTKEWIVKTKFDKTNEQTKEKIGELILEKPIEVLFEGYDESIYGSGYTDDDINTELNSIKENFCFLFTGHWLQGGLGNDRKDVGALIKIFYESFGRKPNKPALILKTCGSTPSVIDRYEVLGKIDQIKKQFPGQNLPPVYLLHGDLTDNQMNALYHHRKVKAMVMFTHGEGFGRPLLEFSTTGKPILVSNWSGHLDFLKKDAVTLIKGRLTDVPKDAFPENIYQEGAQWFTCYFDVVKKELIKCFKQYKKYNKKASRQKVYAKNFTRQKMTEKLGMIIDKYVPEFPTEVALNLPKLKKIEGGQTGAIIPPSNEQKSTKIKLPKLKSVSDGK
jgi:hypothetical protein